MSEKTKQILSELQKDKKSSSKTTMVLWIITGALLAMGIIGAVAESQGIMTTGLVCGSMMVFFMAMRGLIRMGNATGLKKSLKTLEATGALQYIDEILQKEYKSDGKICFSKHYMYVIGKGIFAYEDMLNVDRPKPNNEFYIDTIDGKRHRVIMKVSVMKEFLERQNRITYEGDHKEIREKVRSYKETGVK